MNTKEVMADFKFLGNRVSKLVLETRLIEGKGLAVPAYDFDYKIVELAEESNNFLGVLQLSVHVKAKIKNKILFNIDLVMEGRFTGNSENMSRDKFTEMLEMNGLIVLLHISRAYLVSISAQSGINPPVRFPMINVMKLKELKEKSALTEKML